MSRLHVRILTATEPVDVFDALLALRAALNGEQPPCIKPQNTAGKAEA